MYARKLTKEELMKNGITNVTLDGHVFKGEQEEIPTINKNGYFIHEIYDTDENGNRIKIAKANSAFGYVYKTRCLGLHRLMWAWHYEEVPEGMVVDHINNCHELLEDYDLSNLQLLTPAENLAKERTNWHISEIKCNLSKPRSFYETKLANYIAAYEQAKIDKDAKAAHALRSNISQTRARLRYYDNHIAEYLAKQDPEHDCHARAQKKKELKADIDSARKLYQELLEAYGEADPIVYQYWGEWKMAIVRYNMFCDETKRARLMNC